MYFYLLMAPVVLFGIWFTRSISYTSLDMSLSNKPLWNCIGKVSLVAALMLAVIVGTMNYADRCSQSGMTAYNQGRYAAAESQLSRAEDFDSRNITARFYRGMCLLHDGKKADAISEFQSTCSLVEGQRYTSSTSRQLEQDAQAQLQKLGSKP